MKKFVLFIIISVPFVLLAQTQQPVSRKDKQAQRKEKINQMIKQEEEGALIYQKQGAFGIKLNTDGYGIFYEHGRYKTITKTNLWWMELGERKSPKEEKITVTDQGYATGNPFVFGKINNFYYFKLGYGQQRLIGGKGNKNGVAVSAIYGGGLSLALMKPYYLNIIDPTTHQSRDIKYGDNDSIFLAKTYYSYILGASSFGKGFNEIKVVPAVQLRTALRFDYGRYNEILSAIEVGVNFEYYTQKMQIMALTDPQHAFFNAYIALVFGKRK